MKQFEGKVIVGSKNQIYIHSKLWEAIGVKDLEEEKMHIKRYVKYDKELNKYIIVIEKNGVK